MACGTSLKDVPRGQRCPACNAPWTSPTLRFFWRAQVAGAFCIPLMFVLGAVWMAGSDSESLDWPGRFLLVAFVLGVVHLLAGIGWNCVVPQQLRPRGTARLVAITLLVLLLAGILLPALGRC
ncbi:MAG: hypothetical protein KF699_08505 [Phycisphaeraceae bacterium]|nr:hypothetical protein [Phycisphaeraceae bacterium]